MTPYREFHIHHHVHYWRKCLRVGRRRGEDHPNPGWESEDLGRADRWMGGWVDALYLPRVRCACLLGVSGDEKE